MSVYADRIFPRILDLTDPPGMDEQRALALHGVSGNVLELGLGTGATLHHYPEGVRALTAIEPTGGMHKIAAKRVKEAGRKVEMRQLAGEELPFEEGVFDSVVSVLVLCSVRDAQAVLAEAYRVLRPGGKLYFLEHVASADARVRAWQNRLNSVHRALTCGCELVRDTEQAIQTSSFTLQTLERSTFGGMNAIYPLIRGTAVKPS